MTLTAVQRGWKLHGYQEVARDYLRARGRAGLFLDMGLGKTASCYAALEPRHLPALVVAPKRVAENTWPTEGAIWRPDLRVAVAKGQPDARMRALADEKADVVVIGRDNLPDALKVKRSRKFKTFIIDELSGYKKGGRRGSVRWRTARAIVKRASIEYVWGLTGTPSPNGYHDLWGQVYLLDGGQRLGTTLTAFRERWFKAAGQLPNGVVTKWELRDDTCRQEIDDLLEDLCLAMESEGHITLPEMTENHVEVEMPRPVLKLYRDMKRDLVADMSVLGGEIHTAKTAAALSNRLAQIAAGAVYVDDADVRGMQYQVLHTAKPNAVREIVESDHVGGVLVAYRYTFERDMLKAELGSLAHTIDEPDIVDRWNNREIPVLLAHPASAGHGLNLQHGGHHIVWTSFPNWDLELWQQFNKRLLRQGQEHPVVIHCIMAKHSVNYAERAGLDEKDDVQSALLAHLESPI